MKAKPQKPGPGPVEPRNLPKTIDERHKGVSMLVTQLQSLYKDQGVVVVEDQKKVIYFCAICRCVREFGVPRAVPWQNCLFYVRYSCPL